MLLKFCSLCLGMFSFEVCTLAMLGFQMKSSSCCTVQEYMAQWTARMAAADADYQSSLQASERAAVQQLPATLDAGPSKQHRNAAAAARYAPWVAEAVDVLHLLSSDRGARAADAIREQLLERDQ